jgi:hypothetical protein
MMMKGFRRVRSEAHTGKGKIRVREWPSGGAQCGVTTYSPFVTLSPTWQLLTVDYVTSCTGSNLDLQVLDHVPAAPSEIFQVDNVQIRVVP